VDILLKGRNLVLFLYHWGPTGVRNLIKIVKIHVHNAK